MNEIAGSGAARSVGGSGSGCGTTVRAGGNAAPTVQAAQALHLWATVGAGEAPPSSAEAAATAVSPWWWWP